MFENFDETTREELYKVFCDWVDVDDEVWDRDERLECANWNVNAFAYEILKEIRQYLPKKAMSPIPKIPDFSEMSRSDAIAWIEANMMNGDPAFMEMFKKIVELLIALKCATVRETICCEIAELKAIELGMDYTNDDASLELLDRVMGGER